MDLNEAKEILENNGYLIEQNDSNSIFLNTREITFEDWCSELNELIKKYDLDLESLKKRDEFLEKNLTKFYNTGSDPEWISKVLKIWYKGV